MSTCSTGMQFLPSLHVCADEAQAECTAQGLRIAELEGQVATLEAQLGKAVLHFVSVNKQHARLC